MKRNSTEAQLAALISTIGAFVSLTDGIIEWVKRNPDETRTLVVGIAIGAVLGVAAARLAS
jgi:hypothetical protein